MGRDSRNPILNATMTNPQVSVNNFDLATDILEKANHNSKIKLIIYEKIIDTNKQNKHIPGKKEYEQGRSELTISIARAQKLIYEKSGKGEIVSSSKERIDFGCTIGNYVDNEKNIKVETSIGIVHYSKKGVHIVPARPKEKK